MHAIHQQVFRPLTVRRNDCGTVLITQHSVHSSTIVVEAEAVTPLVQALVAALLAPRPGQTSGGAGAGSEEPERSDSEARTHFPKGSEVAEPLPPDVGTDLYFPESSEQPDMQIGCALCS
jgi:hypothetical protein